VQTKRCFEGAYAVHVNILEQYIVALGT